jgi:hypothetical protein
MRFFEEYCGPANYSRWLFHTSAERQARIFTLSTYKILGESDLRQLIVIADDYILQDILHVQIISIRQPAAKDQFPRRLDFIHPAKLCIVRRGLHNVGIGFGRYRSVFP